MLLRSNCMPKEILWFLNTCTYNKKMESTQFANKCHMPEAYLQWFCTWFGEQTMENACLMAVFVENSTQDRTQFLCCNPANAAVVLQIAESIQVHQLIPASCIVILTPYVKQWSLYNINLLSMVKQANVSIDEYPCVYTVNSYQSKEADWVIFNVMVTGTKLGFMDDEGCTNVAYT